ncbi:MAG: FtsW/RodA/SpoVE family cell cycle protein, partial [Clostridia bacterium]|nr:FtsW/RodA/SpoVE family cell cycle protein [Clostridia bacterium]
MKKKSPDFLLFAIVLVLLTIGIIMVFSSSAVSAAQEFGDPYYYLKRQLMWAFLGSLAMIFVMEIDYFRYAKYIELFLIGSFILLGLVLVAGISSHGSSRWLGVGFLRIQPSEVMKLAMVLFLSKSMSRHPERIQSFSGFIPYLLVLGLACGLILYQPDLGSAVVLAGTTYLLFAAGGARISHLFFLALAGMALIALAIIMAPYRMNRFMAFLDPWADPLGDGFQTIQALLALGSGGLFGLGLGCSRQKLFWLPARHTDFIYAIIGEELGFI